MTEPKTKGFSKPRAVQVLSHPLVSVVIPTYNRRDDALSAVDSVLSQTYRNIQVIVVDDGSTDDTILSLSKRSDPRLVLVGNQHGGVSAARNAGICHASGDLIAFLDDDDRFLPTKIEKFVHFYRRNPSCSFIHSHWFEEDRVSSSSQIIRPYVSGDARHTLLMFAPISITTVMFSRKFLKEKVGLFREDLGLCEDYDLLVRASTHGPVGLIEEPLTIVKIHPFNTPRDPEIVRKNQSEIVERTLDSWPEAREKKALYLINLALYAHLRKIYSIINTIQISLRQTRRFTKSV